jgi:hypothetical protein
MRAMPTPTYEDNHGVGRRKGRGDEGAGRVCLFLIIPGFGPLAALWPPGSPLALSDPCPPRRPPAGEPPIKCPFWMPSLLLEVECPAGTQCCCKQVCSLFFVSPPHLSLFPSLIPASFTSPHHASLFPFPLSLPAPTTSVRTPPSPPLASDLSLSPLSP